jgi:RNA-binding protein
MPDLPDDGRTAAPAPSLSSAERRALRARAHELDPVVMIGDAGLTDAVLAEADRALGAHGLIKVRIFGDDRDARQSMAALLEARTGSALVQAIGKLVVLWRPRAQDTGPIGAGPTVPAPARKRATLSVPKKLAAEGKPAPKRRARPGVPRATPVEAPARRSRAPLGRPVGPGLRAARGALDPSVARPAPGGASSGARTGRPPAAGGRTAAGAGVRPGGGPAGRTGSAGPARRGTDPKAGRGPGGRAPSVAPARDGLGARPARKGASGTPRGDGPPARGGASPARGGASPARGGASPARGGASPARGGASPARGVPSPARGGGTARPAARPPSSGGAGARAPSPARTGSGAPRGTGRGGTSPRGSGRPGPRTRAGRRGP